IIDLIIGFYIENKPINYSFLANIFPDNNFFIGILSLIVVLIIILLTPFLNEEIDENPFFVAIIIKIILYLGSSQYTFLGRVGEIILNLSCTVVIVIVLVFITIIELEEPINYIQVLLLGIILLTINFILNIFYYGWRIEETWAIIFIFFSLGSILLMKNQKLFIVGVSIIFFMTILNDYIISFGLSGLDAGSELLKFTSLLLIIKFILTR
ncbi:MAG: hypothetical protein ACTSQG_02830, partial [Promethearchaeota archaeon]